MYHTRTPPLQVHSPRDLGVDGSRRGRDPRRPVRVRTPSHVAHPTLVSLYCYYCYYVQTPFLSRLCPVTATDDDLNSHCPSVRTPSGGGAGRTGTLQMELLELQLHPLRRPRVEVEVTRLVPVVDVPLLPRVRPGVPAVREV